MCLQAVSAVKPRYLSITPANHPKALEHSARYFGEMSTLVVIRLSQALLKSLPSMRRKRWSTALATQLHISGRNETAIRQTQVMVEEGGAWGPL